MIFKRNQKQDKIRRKYGVIRRQGNNLGLFSFFITILGGIDYCYRNELVPIVDLRTGDNQYKRDKKDNAWEIFFEQPEKLGLDDIKDWREVQIIECEQIIFRPYQNMDFFTNKSTIQYWRKFVKKHINLSKKAQFWSEQFIVKYLLPYKEEKILGILARGTDYIDLRPSGHPVQPSFDELREKVVEIFDRNKCSKIYLVTEDKKICRQFLEYFGDVIILPEAERYDATDGKFLAEINKSNEKLIVDTLNYLSAIMGLAQCRYLVAGRTSGTVAAVILGEGFEEDYFFNLGMYGVDDKEILMDGDV